MRGSRPLPPTSPEPGLPSNSLCLLHHGGFCFLWLWDEVLIVGNPKAAVGGVRIWYQSVVIKQNFAAWDKLTGGPWTYFRSEDRHSVNWEPVWAIRHNLLGVFSVFSCLTLLEYGAYCPLLWTKPHYSSSSSGTLASDVKRICYFQPVLNSPQLYLSALWRECFLSLCFAPWVIECFPFISVPYLSSISSNQVDGRLALLAFTGDKKP